MVRSLSNPAPFIRWENLSTRKSTSKEEWWEVGVVACRLGEWATSMIPTHLIISIWGAWIRGRAGTAGSKNSPFCFSHFEHAFLPPSSLPVVECVSLAWSDWKIMKDIPLVKFMWLSLDKGKILTASWIIVIVKDFVYSALFRHPWVFPRLSLAHWPTV